MTSKSLSMEIARRVDGWAMARGQVDTLATQGGRCALKEWNTNYAMHLMRLLLSVAATQFVAKINANSPLMMMPTRAGK